MNTDNMESTGRGTSAHSAVGMARRRLLLKGVGKGAAVLAATVPIKTLAGQSLLTFDGQHRCSISGMQSGVHSATPLDTARCGGYSISYWSAGTGNPTRTWPTRYQQKCKDVFTGSALDANLSLFQAMKSHPTSVEAHWICAWLNALRGSFNFPYSGPQVLAFYNLGPAAQGYQDALTFFTNFMETHNS